MRFPITPALALTLLVAACDSPAANVTSPTSVRMQRSTSAAVHSLTGSGKLDLSEFDPTLRAETYAFAAFVDGNGLVSGQIEIHLSDPAVAFHADATCLVVENNSAWVGGVITYSSDSESLPSGTQFWVRVQDNGEGHDADRISFVRLGAPAVNCGLKRPATLPFAFSGGNLQVR